MLDEKIILEVLEWPELADIKAELANPKYGTRSHGSRATYALGCHSPLCKYAERTRGRRRTAQKALSEGREVREYDRAYNRDDLIQAIIKWHKRDIAIRRAESREAS